MPEKETAIGRSLRGAADTDANSPMELTPPPKSWTYFFFAGSILATMALGAAGLAIQFFEARPFNLRAQTAYLERKIEETLLKNYVPAAGIRRGTPELRRDTAASWTFQRIEAEIPDQVNLDGLVRLLSEAMLAERVHVAAEPAQGRERRLRLSIADREFASVLLTPAVSPPKMRSDLRAACYRLGEDVERVLLDAGLFREGVVREEPVDNEDDETLWALTRVRAALPESISAQDLKERIKQVTAVRGAWIDVTEPAHGTVNIRVAYGGKVCVDLVCLLTGGVSPPPSPREVGSAAAGQRDLNALVAEALPSLDELPLDSVEHAEARTVRPGILPAPGLRPRVAIILDDGGYGGAVSDAILALDKGLTLAILPNTPHAAETAQAAQAGGFEIMLHMPMETHGAAIKPFPGQLTTVMAKADIQNATRQALAQIPGAVGVNNHMGSKFAEDEERLKSFLEVLKGSSMYFVDSRTLATSKAFDAAVAMGIPAAERDVFLDNDDDPRKIAEQLEVLVLRAKAQGQAIGIGHFRAKTAEALKTGLSGLAEAGVDLVHASELVR